MMVHGNLELLSSFVDDELETPQREAVESHLAACPPCRERLGALRRVVDELRALEAVAPPAALSSRVRRAVLFEGRSGGVLRRSAESLRRWTDQPLLLPLFGVVTALAVLLYLFTAWSDRVAHPSTRLVVGSPASQESRQEPAAGAVADGAVRQIDGRSFERVGGRWVEEGIDPRLAAPTVDLRRPDAAWPELEAFRALGGRVLLLRGSEAVEVDFGPSGG